MEDKITIDRSTFKALAADTRIKILKILDKRRHTQSELSVVLKLAVPTVKEHLGALEKASLVKKMDEGYKWKYYALTEKAKCLLDPERKKVWVLLVSVLISITATALLFFKNIMFAASRVGVPQKIMAAEAAPVAAGMAEDAAIDAAVETSMETTQVAVQTASQFPCGLFILLVLLSVNLSAKN